VLKNLDVQGFRCFRSLQVPIRPLTVLIGRNDTGKSAFLSALRFLVDGGGFQRQDVWRDDQRMRISISGRLENGVEGSISNKENPNLGAFNVLRAVGIYQLPSQGVAMKCNGVGDDGGPPAIGKSGEDVPALFDYLLRQDRKRFFAAVDALKNLIPGLEDLNVASPDPRERRLDLTVEKGFKIPADLSSTGVRMLLTFVAMAYHPRPPGLVLLEEPETGVHPERLADIMRLLREITEGKHGGRAAQVIMTTHSPYLLDLVDVEKDQVLVFRRQDDGSRTAEPADAARLKAFLGEFMLGEVWYNQGEEGLVARH
jgi:predicted ATPase